LYGTGDDPWGILATLWDTHRAVASDSVMVRILYASNFTRTYAGNNLYLLPPDAPFDSNPLLCYVDLAGEVTDYVARKAGSYDIVLVDAVTFVVPSTGTGIELRRFRVTPQPGRATTYVITGRTPETMQLLTVVDP